MARSADGRSGGSRTTLRHARAWLAAGFRDVDLALVDGVVAEVAEAGRLAPGARDLDLEGRVLLPGIVNAHDHLDFSTFPLLGRPPYPSVYEWAADVDAGSGDAVVRAALAVALPDRLFLGGVRNLLAGVTAVAHHNPYHRALGRESFPVRVLAKYAFAHSPGLTPRLRKTYRTTDRRIPWMIHVAEGTDGRCRGELQALVDANVLRQNTVLVHGIGLSPEDARRAARAEACLVWCPESNRNLYGTTADVRALGAAGLRIGLGSDSPVSGVRDALSNVKAARAAAPVSDAELLELATTRSAEVARLPAGAPAVGAPADFVVTASPERLLDGDRRAVALVVVAGRARYGEPALLAALTAGVGLRVDGEPRALDAATGARAASLFRAHPQIRRAAWAEALRFDPAESLR